MKKFIEIEFKDIHIVINIKRFLLSLLLIAAMGTILYFSIWTAMHH